MVALEIERAYVAGATLMRSEGAVNCDERLVVGERGLTFDPRAQTTSLPQHIITHEVLRGFRALACALTVPQAEHSDVRTACEWLLAAGPGAGTGAGPALTVTKPATRRPLDRDQLRRAAKETHDEYVRNQGLNADCILNAVVNRVIDEIEGKIEDEEGVLVKTKRSPAWWDEHTAIQLVVTHLNEHGARVLFSMPGRALTLVAKTTEQAERQLAYARARWPEGVYEIREVRFWRDADGRPGDPVHWLVDDGPS